MNNPYYFTDKNSKTGFKITLDRHNIIHANSLLTIIPIYPDFGIVFRYNDKILQEMGTVYARLINQYMFKEHKFFSASFYKINEEDQRSDEIELFIYLNTNHNLTAFGINEIDVKPQLEHQIQIQGTKKSGWIFDRNKSMKIRFHKTCESNDSNYAKTLSRTHAMLNTESNDKYCFMVEISRSSFL